MQGCELTLLANAGSFVQQFFHKITPKTLSKWSKWAHWKTRIPLKKRSLAAQQRPALCKRFISVLYIDVPRSDPLSSLPGQLSQSRWEAAPKTVLISYDCENDCSAVVIVRQVFIFSAWRGLSESVCSANFTQAALAACWVQKWLMGCSYTIYFFNLNLLLLLRPYFWPVTQVWTQFQY